MARDAKGCDVTDGDEDARPRDLWADVPRRGLPRRRAVAEDDEPSTPSSDVTAPPVSADDPAPIAPRRTASPRSARRRRILRVGVPVAALGLVAALVLPDVLDDDEEPRLARPTSPSVVDASALLPDLVFGEDRSADLPVPPALTGPAEAPSGTGERWRLTSEDLSEIWQDAAPDGADAGSPVLVVANPVTAGAANEANVSGIAPVVLDAYGSEGKKSQTSLLVTLDTDDGSVLWTRPLEAVMPTSCQSIGRGASIACLSQGDAEGDRATFQVTVLESTTGRDAASFVTDGCIPTSFVQQGTRLYWAGVLPEEMAMCLGGGAEHFATLTGSGFVDTSTDWLTMTATGPLLRTPGSSVMLTQDGWRGYRGRVEPAPGGLIVREIAEDDSETVRLDQDRPPAVRSVVSTTAGATVMWAAGTPWRRLDLTPEVSGTSDFAGTIGIGGSAYDVTEGGTVVSSSPVLTIPGVEDTSLDYGGRMPPSVTPAAVIAFVPVDGGVATYTTERWTAASMRAGAPVETHEEPQSLAAVVGRTTLSYEGARDSLGEGPLGATHFAERTLVVEQEDGSTDRVPFRHLYSVSLADGAGEIDLATTVSPIAVVGPMVVIADDGGLVAVS